MVGMNHRFRSDVQAVRGFLAGGDIGPLQAVRSGWYTFQPPRQLAGWRVRRQEAGGGAFLDLGLQLLDLGLWLPGWAAAPRGPPPMTRQGGGGGGGQGAPPVGGGDGGVPADRRGRRAPGG